MNIYEEKVIPLGQELPSELQPKTKYYVQVSPTEFRLCFVDDTGVLIRQEVDDLKTVLEKGESVQREVSPSSGEVYKNNLNFSLNNTSIEHGYNGNAGTFNYVYNSSYFNSYSSQQFNSNYQETFIDGNIKRYKNTWVTFTADALHIGHSEQNYENNTFLGGSALSITDRVKIFNQVSTENTQYQTYEVVADAEGYLAFRQKTTTPAKTYNYIYLNPGSNMNTLLGGENYDFIINQEWGANTFVGKISDNSNGGANSNATIINDGIMNTFTGAHSANSFRGGSYNTFYGAFINGNSNYQQANKNYQTAIGSNTNTLDYGTAVGSNSAANRGGITVGANANAQAYINGVMTFYDYCLVLGNGTDYTNTNKSVSAEQELFVNIYKDSTDTSEPLLRGSFVPDSKYLKINGKTILNPNQNPDVGNDASYTKQVVAKADGTLGFKAIDTDTSGVENILVLSTNIFNGEEAVGSMGVQYNKKGNIVNLHVRINAFSSGITASLIPAIMLPPAIQAPRIIDYRPILLEATRPSTNDSTLILVRHGRDYLHIINNIPVWAALNCTIQYSI